MRQTKSTKSITQEFFFSEYQNLQRFVEPPVRGEGSNHTLMACVLNVFVRCVCVCAWESRGSVGGWAPQSSPSSGVCQRVTAKAEDRQRRVMRDSGKNRLHRASSSLRRGRRAANANTSAHRLRAFVTCQFLPVFLLVRPISCFATKSEQKLK